MIERLCVANRASTHAGQNLEGSVTLENAKVDIERADRIAKTTINRNAFMPLGEKQPKLVSEEGGYNVQTNVQDAVIAS